MPKTLKAFPFTASALLVLGVLLIFGVIHFPRPTKQETEFFHQIETAKLEGREYALFKNATTFDWDTVCVLSPYSITPTAPPEELARYIKADLSSFATAFPDVGDDNAWAFIFISHNKIVQAINTRGEYHFKRSYQDNCLGRGAALKFGPEREAAILTVPGGVQ